MTVKEYAELKAVSKQSVYDKVRRGTLSVEIKDGIKHILESVDTKAAPELNADHIKKYEKTLKKFNKVKHKLDLALNDIDSLRLLLASKDAEIDTLKRTFSLMTVAIENRLVAPVDDVIEADTVPISKKKKKKKK